ncbi:LVIVD repeat-containing protein [Usitatibacter palustris]|uniref:LVIVD repeat-containing protein n=1 Tax=Usitatibacter palustris TaxID=2732487 RepID=A0A6M4H8M1_9PROT|nr:hypothetical protein [Usitatibacter palustris]QJR15063.1 hypothetical protein DSM104440_01879 [Usitatibacter palustris]
MHRAWPFFILVCTLTAAAHEARDMALVGAHSLQGRSSYQPVIHRVGDRWIAFIGHHAGRAVNPLTNVNEENGTSLLDVTDPRAPKLVAHIPGDGGAQMARFCNGYLLRTLGHSAHEVWDVRNPVKPVKASTVVSGLSDTHKSWWECDTGIAYLVAGAPGWRTSRMTQVFDLSDPAKPKFIRNFGLVGQQPGASGDVPTGLHGPISTGPTGNRIYFGYGTNSRGVLQIVDRKKLLDGAREPTEANLLAPQVGRFDFSPSYGAHTAFPILGLDGRDVVLVVNEALTYHCNEAHQKAWLVDVTTEAKPTVISTWEAPDEKRFCAKGRFGAHSSNESFAPIYYRKLVFIAYFNAGVRVLDIRDPKKPAEVAYFIPDGSPLTNNVEVDERGYVYIVDRGSLGLHVLELTGNARRWAQ